MELPRTRTLKDRSMAGWETDGSRMHALPTHVYAQRHRGKCSRGAGQFGTPVPRSLLPGNAGAKDRLIIIVLWVYALVLDFQ